MSHPSGSMGLGAPGARMAAVNTALRRVPVWPFYFGLLIPGGLLFYDALGNRLGADPVARLEHETGLLALQLLIAALVVSPLRDLTGINLLRFRRMIGLMAFVYACLHVLIWAVLDRQLDMVRIGADLVKRPYIIVGTAAFLLLIPLAWTSRDAALRRMGAVSWRRLHRLAYPATLLAAAHFIWLVKAWPPEPMIYGAIALSLVLYRVLPRRRRSQM